MGGEMTYTFKADGKLVVSALGAEVEGTWSQKDKIVTVTVDGQSQDMTLDGDKLTIVQNDVTVIFKKK